MKNILSDDVLPKSPVCVADTEKTSSWEVLAGRVIVVMVNWKNHDLFLLAVYEFNNATESREMWKHIREWLEQNKAKVPRIDCMLGDINLVEDDIDRIPSEVRRSRPSP